MPDHNVAPRSLEVIRRQTTVAFVGLGFATQQAGVVEVFTFQVFSGRTVLLGFVKTFTHASADSIINVRIG